MSKFNTPFLDIDDQDDDFVLAPEITPEKYKSTPNCRSSHSKAQLLNANRISAVSAFSNLEEQSIDFASIKQEITQYKLHLESIINRANEV